MERKQFITDAVEGINDRRELDFNSEVRRQLKDIAAKHAKINLLKEEKAEMVKKLNEMSLETFDVSMLDD